MIRTEGIRLSSDLPTAALKKQLWPTTKPSNPAFKIFRIMNKFIYIAALTLSFLSACSVGGGYPTESNGSDVGRRIPDRSTQISTPEAHNRAIMESVRNF